MKTVPESPEAARDPAATAFAAPGTLEAAVRFAGAGGVTILAGGTDLLPQQRAGRGVGPRLLGLRRVAELRGITAGADRVRIGATTSVTDVLESEALSRAAPVLVQAADHFASEQVRNGATVGGNIANASPAGDLIVPLLLLDAEVELARWNEQGLDLRTLRLDEFLTGPGATRLEPGELIVAVEFRTPPSALRGHFEKFGTRPALDISIVSVGVAARPEDGLLTDVRVALGAVAPTALRARAAERVLEGNSFDDATCARAVAAAQEAISPIDDVRASAWYRRELVGVLLERSLRRVARAGD